MILLFYSKVKLTEFFRSTDTNENENNATSEKSLVRDKSSFCSPRNRYKKLYRSIDFLNNLEIDFINKDFEGNLSRQV